jgi:hypothetical protein
MIYSWKKVANRSLPNLHVLSVAEKEVGFIYKPCDDKANKNMWRGVVGIGDIARFAGHFDSKTRAMAFVETQI